MRIISTDTETGLILPGLLTPPLACLTWTERNGTDLPRNILSPKDGVEWFWQMVRDQDVCQTGFNLIFDLGVLVEACPERHQPELLSAIFRAIEDGRVSQTDTRESLLLLADGLLSWHPQENRKPGVGMEDVAKRRLGIDISADKKNPDAWRIRYGELIGVPLDLWPAETIRYAVDDPCIALLCWEHQLEEAQRERYLDPNAPWLVIDEGRKVAMAWALHLCSLHGIRTDADRVASTAARIEQAGQAVERLLLATGLGEQKKKEGRAYVGQRRKDVQARVALVYAGLHADPELLAEMSAGYPEADDDEEIADLTPEQARQLTAIVENPETVKLPELVLPPHLEPYQLPRLTWGAPKTPEQELELQEREGMLILGKGEDGGWSWGPPEGALQEDILSKCSGQVVLKTDITGGGIAYRDTQTGQLVTPTTEPSKSFPEGQVSWSREVLELSGDPLLQLVAALGRVTKLRTTYVPILSHGTKVPIQARYWLPKESGRTSASGPNVQNLPAFGGIRECLVARNLRDFSPRYAGMEGRCAILASDVDQAECVAWAQDCLERFGFSRMAEVLLSGKDLHTWTAIHFPSLQGMSYEEAFAKKEAGDPVIKKVRASGKAGIFSWMGGAGAFRISKIAQGMGLEMSLEQARDVIEVLNQAYPEGRYAARWASEMCAGESTFTFVQRVSLRRRGGCGYTDGRNTVFQGGIADFAGDVLFHAAVECYTGRVTSEQATSCWPPIDTLRPAGEDLLLEKDLIEAGTLSPLYGARPWVFEHDGFLYEIPYDAWGPERSTLAAERLEAIIRERGAFWFPDLPTRSTCGCARKWIKDRGQGLEMKQVRNAAGLIIPMDDPEAIKK